MTYALKRFLDLWKASDTLIPQVQRKAEVARVLALHVGHYRRCCEGIPVDESRTLYRSKKLNNESSRNRADGFDAPIEVPEE